MQRLRGHGLPAGSVLLHDGVGQHLRAGGDEPLRRELRNDVRPKRRHVRDRTELLLRQLPGRRLPAALSAERIGLHELLGVLQRRLRTRDVHPAVQPRWRDVLVAVAVLHRSMQWRHLRRTTAMRNDRPALRRLCCRQVLQPAPRLPHRSAMPIRPQLLRNVRCRRRADSDLLPAMHPQPEGIPGPAVHRDELRRRGLFLTALTPVPSPACGRGEERGAFSARRR